MAGTRDDMLRVARSQIGVKESPAGSNRVKYTRWYGLVGPWCAMFQSWCAEKAGIPHSVIPKHAYTPDGRAWFRSHGQWGRKPRVGAIVYYQFPGFSRVSHVGVVEKVHSDGTWTAIEGNTDEAGGRTGGKVMRKRRSRVGSLGGFGYPKYAAAPKKTAAKKKAPAKKPTSGPLWKQGRAPKGYRLVKMGQMLTRGTYGDPVGRVQKMLGLTIDYAYGPGLERAVRAFQRKWKLTTDGVVGPKTWTSLKKHGKK